MGNCCNLHGAQVGLHLLLKVGDWRRVIAQLRRAPEEKRRARLAEVVAAGEELVTWSEHKSRRDRLDRARLALVVNHEHQALREWCEGRH